MLVTSKNMGNIRPRTIFFSVGNLKFFLNNRIINVAIEIIIDDSCRRGYTTPAFSLSFGVKTPSTTANNEVISIEIRMSFCFRISDFTFIV